MARTKAPPTPQPWQNRIVGIAAVDPATLAPHPLNWRRHPETQKAALRGVLREVGLVQEVLVSQQTGCLLDGHLRVALALEEHQPTIPIKYVDLSEAEERLVLATLDPLAALAETDATALTALLAEVRSADAGVQTLLQQLQQETALALGETAGPLQDVEPQLDRAEALREQWGVEMGQLWQLGRHRVVCADCLEMVNVQRVLGSETPIMVFADPPYGVNIVATNGFVGGGEAYNIPFGGVQSPRPRGHVGGGESYKARHGKYAIQREQRRGTVGAAKPFGSKPVRGTVGAAHVVDVGKYAPVIGDGSPETAIKAVHMLLAAYPQAVQVWWGGNYYADALPASSCCWPGCCCT